MIKDKPHLSVVPPEKMDSVREKKQAEALKTAKEAQAEITKENTRVAFATGYTMGAENALEIVLVQLEGRISGSEKTELQSSVAFLIDQMLETVKKR